jgi:hypothetical protein
MSTVPVAQYTHPVGFPTKRLPRSLRPNSQSPVHDMKRRKPHPRLVVTRNSDNDKRRLRTPVPSNAWLLDLANRASFEGYSKHKLHPRAFHLEPFTGQREDATYCDGHAQFTPADMARVPALLRRGILSGLVGENDDNRGDPTLLWSIDDNGWIYEARLTIPGRALYHGYPVLRSEAIARAIIARYIHWVYNSDAAVLFSSVQELQERYA